MKTFDFTISLFGSGQGCRYGSRKALEMFLVPCHKDQQSQMDLSRRPENEVTSLPI